MICPPEHKHGATSTCYTGHKCRCVNCTSARTRYYNTWAEANSSAIPNRVHGSQNGYANYKCRCTDCKRAWAEYASKRRKM